MMVVAEPTLCAQLAAKTNWPSLYWWNAETPGSTPVLQNHKLESPVALCIPAYNFDLLFEKLRPVFLAQDDKDLLQAFKLMLQVSNPANSLAKLAISLAEKGLLK
jgi:hypothetical protein